ncbi:unnamed protein product [Rotaria sordida]|uniref:Uncharacterized protein n=3 Tax=Rotaria sordida TaxID=392033 RepID=A0A815MGK3_9BILA|nr:unnamed protein product [Rotaria sordida]
MASAALSNDDFPMNTDDKNLEIFSLIWLDKNANIKDTRDTEQKLRSIINHLKKFEDVKQCQQFIEQRSKKDRLMLIVNGQLGQEIVPLIHNLRQVMSIYVYCMDKKSNEQWAYKFAKVKSVIVDLDELIFRITEDHKIQKKVEEPLSINVFTTNSDEGKSTTGLNGQFVFSQVLIDCLVRLKSTQTDKTELINLCKTEYAGNHSELNNLREFEEEYSSNKVLWWYTKDSFFYKTLNAALRTQNIHMIFLFREFISDIHRQLQYDQTNNPLQVYRSQLISNDELDYLKQNIGQFISINSFFSTSTNRTTALFFLGDTTSLIGLKLVGILFEIDADPQMVTTKPFADISKYSHFTNESEVLFMIGSLFHLNSIICNDDHVWIIKMSLCSDDENDLKQVLLRMKQQLGKGETNLRTLGRVLWEMGKLDLAEKYIKRLLNELPSNNQLRCNLYEDLGKIASQKGDYDMSIQWYQKALEVPKQNISTDTKWKQRGISIVKENSAGITYGLLSCPFGICSDDDQNIYIVDHFNHRIVEWKCNATNDPIVAGRDGSEDQTKESHYPKDVIIDKEKNSWITSDYYNRRVMRWSLDNNIKNGEIIIKDIACYGLAMDKNGSLYVSDYSKNEVRRWKRGDQSGTIVAGGNGKGNDLNQLNAPTFIFVDEDYSLYISDRNNHRVMKWLKGAKEGIVVADGNGCEDSWAHFLCPEGVIVDQLGQIYVADSFKDRVIRWCKGTEEGTIIVGGNGRGEQSNQLNYPTRLSFDREGNLYVVNWGNNRIQKFEIKH